MPRHSLRGSLRFIPHNKFLEASMLQEWNMCGIMAEARHNKIT
jgi:hypothetical protein